VGGKDKAELSDNARLLARARVSLDNVSEVESEKVQMLRKQVESGDYTIQVEEIARRLMRLLR
jgi:flagellar biosynthesis anti-sigma factor FlgM